MRNGILETGLIKSLIILCLLSVASFINAGQYKVTVSKLRHDVQNLSQKDKKNNPYVDQNGERCALIIFETPLGNDLRFDLGSLDVEHSEILDDEIWLWVSPDARKMTIRCTGCEPLKNYQLGTLKSCNVYTAKITTGLPQESNLMQNVHLHCEHVPFTVSFDGKAPVICNNKDYYDTLQIGTHDLLVQSKLYKPYEKSIKLARNKACRDTITLEPNYGGISVFCTQADYTVKIDDEEILQRQFPIHVEAGTHIIEISKDRYQPLVYETPIQVGADLTLNANLKPAFSIVTIQAPDDETEIWIDDKYIGHGIRDIEIVWGTHKIEGRRHNYDTWEYPVHDFTESSPNVIKIPKLTQQFGGMYVSFFPKDVTAYLDGQPIFIEEGAYMNNYLPIGEHIIAIERENYKMLKDTFTIERGLNYIESYKLEYKPTGNVSITTDKGVAIYRKDTLQDGGYDYFAYEQGAKKIPIGETKIMLKTVDGVSCEYDMFVNNDNHNEPVTFPFMRTVMFRSQPFVRPNIYLKGEKESYNISPHKKVKVLPQKYAMYVTKKGFQTYEDSIDLTTQDANKIVKYTYIHSDKDSLENKSHEPKKSSSKVRQSFYDNAGTWFFGIADIGYTFGFDGYTHHIDFGVLPFRYKMLGVNLFDFEIQAKSGSNIETLYYRPKLSLVLPCGRGFAFTLFGGASLNIHDAFVSTDQNIKKNARTRIFGGLSMLINASGKVPVSIFTEYQWPVVGPQEETKHAKDEAVNLFRVGLNIALGFDR